MTSFYTRTGDAGETSLYSGERVAKGSLRVEAYGTIDELQASLGMARALTASPEIGAALLDVEQRLVQAMAELATLDGQERITADDVTAIEGTIDRFSNALPGGFRWSVPGDSRASAALHLARTVARRAERVAVRLDADEDVGANLMRYLNRISDLCYAMARYEDEAAAPKG